MASAPNPLTPPLLPTDFATAALEDASGLLADPKALQAHSKRLGYVFLPRLLPIPGVDAVRALVRSHAVTSGWVLPDEGNPPTLHARPGARMTGRGWNDPAFIALQRAVNMDPGFLALAQDDDLMAALAAVVGEPMALATSNHCWLKLPGSPEHTTRPHQDTFYLPECPQMWTVWIPLSETPLEVGPLGVVPGSHTRTWPHVDAQTGILVPSEVTWHTGPAGPGAALLFNAATVHCAWSNVSTHVARLSLDVRYEPASLATHSILRPGAAR